MRAASTLAGVAFTSLLWPAAANDTPDLALLEFLGEFEDQSGVWLDPLALDVALDKESLNKTPPATVRAADTAETQP